MFKLRDYQQTALDKLFAYWDGDGGNGLIVLPTGAGKSLIIAALCQKLVADYPAVRIGIITHVRELIAQDHMELMDLWPDAPAGIYSAGMRRRDTEERILFMGIQSVFKKTTTVGVFDLLLIDEAHLVSHEDKTMYRRFIKEQRAIVPDLRIVGLTATAFRLDTGQLHKGFGKIFDDIVYEVNVRDLIDAGWLCKLTSKATTQKLDVKGVGKRGGDFIVSELEQAIDQPAITRAACEEIIDFSEGRKAWLVFCISVAHGKHVRDTLRELGIHAEAVFGNTPKIVRDRHIEDFRQGKIRALISVQVLGIGFNVPQVDLIALLRPTESAGLFVQQVGRGLRNAPSKENCLVLDFAGNTRRLGPVDMVGSVLVNPSKECPECAELVSVKTLVCPSCKYVFPDIKPPAEDRKDGPKERTMHDKKADLEVEIISNPLPQWVTVDAMSLSLHRKYGDPLSTPTMRVDYRCGRFNRYSEWVCLSHPEDSYPYKRAEAWWLYNRIGGRAADDDRELPGSVEEAIRRQHELRQPVEIMVKRKGQFFEIMARRFADETLPLSARSASSK